MIYVRLVGRLGNQLFMYCIARRLQLEQKNPETIVFEDTENLAYGFGNSLLEYDLENVEYLHTQEVFHTKFRVQAFIMRMLAHFERSMDAQAIHSLELKLQPLFRAFHMYRLQDGYIDLPRKIPKNIYVDGYFQSEKYVNLIRQEMIDKFVLHDLLNEINYPNIDKIRERNTVCVTIRVAKDYRNNPMYNVCTIEYWQKAIERIVSLVENPLFFLCADDMELAKTLVPILNDYECVEQAAGMPAHITLSAMAECKHFVISNSSFSWWAQYLADYENKIVIAPSKWYTNDVPTDIMQSTWQKIDV